MILRQNVDVSARGSLDEDYSTKSSFKAMLNVFFDIEGVIVPNWGPDGVKVKQHYYKIIL